MSRYIPRQGDFIVLSFDPQSGHEQKGRRPALVVSKSEFNERAGLVIACPITNTTATPRSMLPYRRTAA